MKLIVGLGNPSDKYQNTRHNIGFILIDKYARKLDLNWVHEKKFNGDVAKGKDANGEELVLIKPTTYMNNSGDAVSNIANFYKLEPKDITIIHDDMDLKFGQIKKQFDASSAGHHGVESIIEKLGTQGFWRIRVGIGRSDNPNIAGDVYVLEKFTPQQLDLINTELNIENIL